MLVLTFNRTLEGYVAELARKSTPDDDALDLEVSTFSRWAKSLVDDVRVLPSDERSTILRGLLKGLVPSERLDFFVDEIEYVLGRFEPDGFSGYLDVVREGRGREPRVDRRMRGRLLSDVLPAYEAEKVKRGRIDWNDLAVRAAQAEPDQLYDVVIVDEAQDFSANQVRALMAHLQDDHSTTFVLDAVQRIYPRYFKWSEVGIRARPEIISTLRENYRNTQAIAAFAHRLVENLPEDDDGTLPDFNACGRPGVKPLVVAGKYSAQLEVMLDRLDQVADLETQTVSILKPRGGGWFAEVRKVLRRRGIGFCELTRDNEWPTCPVSVALCTIHSAKGLEFDHVLMPGLSQEVTPHGLDEGDADLERLRRMLAMAVGRARGDSDAWLQARRGVVSHWAPRPLDLRIRGGGHLVTWATEAEPQSAEEIGSMPRRPEVVDAALDRGISSIVHFTRIRGLVGIMDSRAVKARRFLPDEDRLKYVYEENAPDRSRDTPWHGYVSMSVTDINRRMFRSSEHHHAGAQWVILDFSPEILGDPGVVFSTTNNAYENAHRRRGLLGFEQMFAEEVPWGHFGTISTRRGKAPNQTTDSQAEVLYPGQLDLDHLRRVIARDEATYERVVAVRATFVHCPYVDVIPEAFV